MHVKLATNGEEQAGMGQSLLATCRTHSGHATCRGAGQDQSTIFTAILTEGVCDVHMAMAKIQVAGVAPETMWVIRGHVL